MRVLLLGELNAEILAQELQYYGVKAQSCAKVPHPFFYRNFDIIYGIGLLHPVTIFLIKFWRKKCVVHAIGSDVPSYANVRGPRHKLWNLALQTCDEVLYVSEWMKQETRFGRGEVIPIPIDTKIFKKQGNGNRAKRDVLYYCPDPAIYRLDYILRYAKEHPNETITIIGYPSAINLPNVKTILNVPYNQMLELYKQHRRLIRMTTHDGRPKMPYEAFLCGLDVIWNSQKISNVPQEMLMENTIPRLIEILRSLR